MGAGGGRGGARDEAAPIGREDELRAARAALRTGGAALLTGPAGIGRTALADALAAEAARCGAVVLRCAPAVPERALPYVGLGDLLAGLPGGRPAALLDALPQSAGAAPAAALPRPCPGAAVDRLALGRGLVELLRLAAAPAEGGGLLLVLDDLQWLDVPSARALGFALRRAGGAQAGVRVLATVRDGAGAGARGGAGPTAGGPAADGGGVEKADAQDGPGGDGAVRWWEVCPPSTVEVRLAALAPTAVADLLARDLGGPLPAVLLRDVQRVAAGNPGHALELARAGTRLGLVTPYRVPPSLRAQVLERLRPYGAAERQLLLAAAAATRPTLALLRRAAGSEPLRLLDGALRAGLLELVDTPSTTDPVLGAAGPAGELRAGELRFGEPMVPTVLLAEASPAELASARAALAAVEPDPDECVRLAALAQLDAPGARALAEAARRAHRRGAPETAYELAVLAIRQGSLGARTVVDAADYASDAAHWPQARALALQALGAGPQVAVALRTRARVVLLRSAGQALAGFGELIADGLAELGTLRRAGGGSGAGGWAEAADGAETAGWAEPELLRWAAERHLLAGNPEQALTVVQAALTSAVPGALAQRVAALGTLAVARAARGELSAGRRALAEATALTRQSERGARGPDPRLCLLTAELALDDPAAIRAALAASAATGSFAVPHVPHVHVPHVLPSATPPDAPRTFSPAAPPLAVPPAALPPAVGLAIAGPRAERVFSPLAAATTPDLLALGLRCAAHAQLGEVAAATAAATRLSEALAALGEPLAHPAPAAGPVHGPALHAVALAELVGGSARLAGELARRAAAGAAAAGDRWHQVRALGVLGESGLLRGDAAATAAGVEVLQEARRLSAAAGFADPAAVRRLALLAEGLAALGEHGAAAQALHQGGELASRWAGAPQAPALAVLDRSAGLAQAGVGNGREAVELLRRSAERQRALGLPLDLARTLVALGSVERRLRHRPGARAALLEARDLCADHGARPLLARVARELERLDQAVALPGSDGGLLTASEQRMAGLAADGASNREVAAALFVSVKTVEGTLSRVYRKLGVRSRAGLARALATGG
ncbi:AAA family ATPase [Kitasatospora sp. NBC_01287]|uniref:helix-turn-helix transcriptional regulator n=1 Tax=Kitasatospora sp. NBC_01287 TaxID=2903573 RepID=UPI00224EEEE8|nr:AAA family ATPase [Kitasatospora sp. NBC_01287]MCX4747172.1 AAA family ATPase [Kitasatospora sp. NBC_01287]